MRWRVWQTIRRDAHCTNIVHNSFVLCHGSPAGTQVKAIDVISKGRRLKVPKTTFARCHRDEMTSGSGNVPCVPTRLPSPSLDPSAVDGLSSALRGELFHPGERGYDDAPKLVNAMIDRGPAVIVRPADAEDICRAVTFARANHSLSPSKAAGALLGDLDRATQKLGLATPLGVISARRRTW